MSKSLQVQHEEILKRLRAQRLAIVSQGLTAAAADHYNPRSVTMRFILRRPELCLWLVGEIVPFFLNRFVGSAAKRKARARRENCT